MGFAIGSLIGRYPLLFLVWIVFVNLFLYTLLGENENRLAHRKKTYPFLLLVLTALLGGGLGGWIGHLRFRSVKGRTSRGILFFFSLVLQVVGIPICLRSAGQTFARIVGVVTDDFRRMSDILIATIGGAVLWISVAFAVMSVLTFAVFAMDKRIAIKGRGCRVPEVWLMGLAVLGGAAGGLLSMYLFRHKTRHAKFAVWMPVLTVCQSVLLGILFWG